MKRSHVLSALLVGFSLTTATVSLAAPNGAKKAKAVKTQKKKKEAPKEEAPAASSSGESGESTESTKSADKAKEGEDTKPASTSNVAQNQTTPASDVAQGDPAPAPSPAPAPDGASTQPASGTGTDGTSTPAISLTTSPTPTDQPQTAPSTPANKPKPRPFAGSALYNQNSMSTGTVFRGQQQSYNPTVESTLWFLPRYAINDAFQLRGRLIMSYEYTNSASTRYRNEPILSDTTLSLFYRKLPQIPGVGIKPMIAANFAVPTSKASRARTMMFAPGATLQLVKQFEHVLGGDIGIISSAIYSHPVYQSRVPEVVDGRPEGAFQCVGGSGDCNNLSAGGTLNPSDTLSWFLLLEGEWGKWNPALYYLGASQWVYAPKDVTYNQVVPGGGDQLVGSGQSAGPPGVRQTHYFSAWVDYNFNSWFTGEVGYWNSRTALNENGQRGNIFFDRFTDMRVYLGASIQLDNLVKALQGRSEGEAGVVRAHNTKRPMWNF